MLKKIYVTLHKEGYRGLLQVAYRKYRYYFPFRIKYFEKCRVIFENGVGLEIGGPSSVFGVKGIVPVYPVAKKINNINFSNHTTWEDKVIEGNSFKFNEHDEIEPGYQYIGEAANLDFVKDFSYDFVLSSHCIEHLANPIQGLSEWVRVLKNDGLLVLVVPHKDGTFDHLRPVTTLGHLVDDFNRNIDEGDLTHLDEILSLHDLGRDPCAGDIHTFRERSKKNKENRCLHHHVFDTQLTVQLVNYINLQILSVELFPPFHIVIIAKKVKKGQKINNIKYLDIGAILRKRSPFPSDKINKNLNIKNVYN